jgi:hypothetical protein
LYSGSDESTEINETALKNYKSFHTMIHASKPIFIAGWSVALGLEKPNLKMFFIVCSVAFGLMLLSFGESGIKTATVSSKIALVDSIDNNTRNEANSVELDYSAIQEPIPRHDPGFNPDGFALILFSCFISGARWSLVQLMLQRVDLRSSTNQLTGHINSSLPPNHGHQQTNKERLTPFNLLFYVAPIGAFALLPFFVGFELDGFQQYLERESSATSDLFGFELVLSIWSLFLNLTEFYYVRWTSGLILSFAAISKELLLVTISVIVNKDSLPWLNVVGFIFCLGGIVAYHRMSESIPEDKYAELEEIDIDDLEHLQESNRPIEEADNA